MCPRVRLRVRDHDAITKSFEGPTVQDLGEEVREVVLGVDVGRDQDGLVPEHSDPLLAAVDVLELGSPAGCVDEGLGGRVVDLKDDGEREPRSPSRRRCRTGRGTRR